MTTDERLWKTFNKALGQFQLIDEDDRILVGLSGGKDSLLLLEFLARRQKILKPHFTVEAVHVRMENIHYETDTTYLQSFCDTQGVPLHIVTTSFEESSALSPFTQHRDTETQRKTQRPLCLGGKNENAALEENSAPCTQHSALEESSVSQCLCGERKNSEVSTQHSALKKKPACFLCSWQRRKQLFNLAQELHCTKIALGHHQDDIIHTALLNLTFQGHFSTMPAKLKMRKMPLTIIRPLCLCHEDDIRLYAESHHYEKQLKQCPYEHDTYRTSIQDLFTHMQQLNPEARHSIWRALEADDKL